MPKIRIAPTYSADFLEVERPSPLTDKKIEQTIKTILSGNIDLDTSDDVYDEFVGKLESWIFSSKLNHFSGISEFTKKDIIIGCTQFIDSLYMKGTVQTLSGDYRYHQRLGIGKIVTVGNIIPNVPMIIAMPYPSYGNIHPLMDEVLAECQNKNVSVHIDGAWIPCCKNINFDFSNPCIESIGISLSKGLGLGWNRIGVRWSKQKSVDAITIMNDFHMSNKSLVVIGRLFLESFPSDYLWTTHQKNYEKVCKDFDLSPTNAVHLAMKNNQPVGISPLLRYLENENTV